ncbi:DUF4844 domain-containing protein [Sphingobacterium athyrii]|uniref:DUF4844 domain-containing protein n=1 Tax=Sphingobacterium athyrii TaxID=2152717 RepID=A0A363NUF5_9SPHI|nr:DUF4844 domain-containing protein [Sphingobacterium athyrii]PUV24414.1 hypothetical protein DCO56_13800 [Sphingobacterium athyrii]
MKLLNKSFVYRFVVLFLLTLAVYSCNKSMDNNTMKKVESLEKLKKEPKFIATAFYPGLENKENQKALSDLFDSTINEFIKGAEDNFSDVQYQDLMKVSLKKFDIYNLDTEDREYICGYYEKIMDAIELESSGGVLNEWMYGFDV